MHLLWQVLYVPIGDTWEDGGGEGICLQCTIRDEVGYKEGIIDRKAYVAGEDLVVVLQRCQAKHFYPIPLENG